MADEIITKQELIDAKVDAQTLEDIINDGPEIQVQTRLGRLVWTLATLEQRSLLKIQEWQNAIDSIVIDSGVPAMVVVDSSGVTQQEINDLGGVRYWTEKSGGYQVNYEVRLENGDIVKSTIPNNIIDPNVDTTGWTNKVGSASQISISSDKTQADKNSLTVDLLDFIPKSEWESILENTGSYDCTPALVQAVAKGKKVTIGQSGTYKINTPYLGTTDFELEATAPDVTLDCNGVTTGYAIQNSGSLTKIEGDYGAIQKGDRIVELSSVSGLSVGDWVCFWNPTPFSYSAFETQYYAGEWKQIYSITENVVYFTGAFYDSYPAGSTELYKLNSVKCKISNLKLKHDNGATGCVRFSLSSDASDENITFDVKLTAAAISYSRCLNHISINPIGLNTLAGDGNYYGIVVGNSQHGRIHGGNIYATRHAVTLGGGSEIGSVPVSDFRCYGAVLSSTNSVGAADMHGNVRDSSYEDCTLYGHAKIGGGDKTYYKRCNIYSDVLGLAGTASHILGGDFGWIDCEVFGVGNNPQNVGLGVFDIGGVATTGINEKTTRDCNIRLTANVYGGSNYSPATNLVNIRNRGSLKKININMDGINLKTDGIIGRLLRMDVVSGVADSDSIIIDNLGGKIPFTLTLLAETLAGQSYLNKPMRLQSQRGKSILTTTAATNTTTANVPLTFEYPRVPSALISARGVNGAAKSTIGGQRGVAISVYSQTVNAIRFNASSQVAMTADDQVEIMYEVGIKEC